MSDEINELNLLLAKLNTTIEVNEEKLRNKVDNAEFLKEMVLRDKDIYKDIEKLKNKVDKLNDRITGLYLKIAGATGIIVGIIELLS